MKKTTLFKMMFLGVFTIACSSLSGQVLMTSTGSYSQDFNSLASSGTGKVWSDNSTIANWYTGQTAYNAGTGSATTGALYSFGTTGNSDRALGSLGSNSAGDFAYGLMLKNTSSFTITDIKVSFTGEQWRAANAAAQTVSFFYKISGTSFTALNPNNNSGWTAVSTLNFTSPKINTSSEGAIDGNSAANKVLFTDISIPTLSLPAGSYIMLKWDDPNQTGSDHGLAIDDVNISWTVPNPTITVTETSIEEINGSVGETTTTKIHVAGTELTGDISFSFSGANGGLFTTDPLTLSPASGTVTSTEVSVKYTPIASGTQTTTLTVSSQGATSIVLPITAKAIATGVKNTATEQLKVYVTNDKVMFRATAGESVKIFNSIGQVILNKEATEGLNEISVTNKGLHIIKVGNKTSKIIL